MFANVYIKKKIKELRKDNIKNVNSIRIKIDATLSIDAYFSNQLKTNLNKINYFKDLNIIINKNSINHQRFYIKNWNISINNNLFANDF